MKTVFLAATALTFLSMSCAEPQRVVRFTTAATAVDAFDVAVRTLAAKGLQTEAVDRSAGLVQTTWEDSGFGYGFVGPGGREPATIHRRYVAIVTRLSSGYDVVLRQDSRRCGPAHILVPATCVPMDELVASHQQALDTLGDELRGALNAAQ